MAHSNELQAATDHPASVTTIARTYIGRPPNELMETLSRADRHYESTRFYLAAGTGVEAEVVPGGGRSGGVLRVTRTGHVVPTVDVALPSKALALIPGRPSDPSTPWKLDLTAGFQCRVDKVGVRELLTLEHAVDAVGTRQVLTVPLGLHAYKTLAPQGQGNELTVRTLPRYLFARALPAHIEWFYATGHGRRETVAIVTVPAKSATEAASIARSRQVPRWLVDVTGQSDVGASLLATRPAQFLAAIDAGLTVTQVEAAPIGATHTI